MTASMRFKHPRKDPKDQQRLVPEKKPVSLQLLLAFQISGVSYVKI